jgi:hypothetical protein
LLEENLKGSKRRIEKWQGFLDHSLDLVQSSFLFWVLLKTCSLLPQPINKPMQYSYMWNAIHCSKVQNGLLRAHWHFCDTYLLVLGSTLYNNLTFTMQMFCLPQNTGSKKTNNVSYWSSFKQRNSYLQSTGVFPTSQCPCHFVLIQLN